MCKLTTLVTEDARFGESYITFDLRFSLTLREKSVKIIINLEAQKTKEFSYLGYHLENRITYYMARLISSQKETEFFHTDYDNIKKYTVSGFAWNVLLMPSMRLG